MTMKEMGFAGTAGLGAATLVASNPTVAYDVVVDEETRTELLFERRRVWGLWLSSQAASRELVLSLSI